MESREIFQAKFFIYQKAVDGFKESLEIDISIFDEIVQDSIRNGQIQKFEYCTELTWKMIKKFLYIYAGLDTHSPKESIKTLFLSKQVDQCAYECLIEMIDDRNRLSHMYRHEYFEEIHSKLNNYNSLMVKVIEIIRKEVKK